MVLVFFLLHIVSVSHIIVIDKLMTLIVFRSNSQFFSAEVTITTSEVDTGRRRSSMMLKIKSFGAIRVKPIIIESGVILGIMRRRMRFELLFVSDVHFKVNF